MEGRGPFLFGPRVMEVEIRTSVTVMATQTVFIHYQSAVPQKTVIYHGILRRAPQRSPPPTAVVQALREK